MSQSAPVSTTLDDPLPVPEESTRVLLRQLLALALPVLAEHVLHILVGWTDTYLANHMHAFDAASAAARAEETAAGAAVGTMTFILWFVGIVVSAVGSGSTAIIARAIGAKHRSLANSICGQSISAAIMLGGAVGVLMYFFADPIASSAGLEAQAHDFAMSYMRILSIALPFSIVMFVANSCLRGAGDTLTPAITMIIVDVINMFFSAGLTFGWAGLPRLGFDGIAWGTSIAYFAGGVIQFIVLIVGRGGIRLFFHRMRPHWHNLKRLLRIGVPGGTADFLHWAANFEVVRLVNQMGVVQGNAHNIAIRIESMSYMIGFAIATAAATMVGQSLGMRRPRRAQRAALLSYALGGGVMTLAGIGFIFLGRYPAMLFSTDPAVRDLVTRCLFITGFIQCGFASAMIFGGALRGAGDTFYMMLLNSLSVFGLRLFGTIVVVRWLHLGLNAVWVVLASELFVRGILMFGRFVHGGWKRVKV
jgi:putative MATE family efflux protein